MRDAALLWNDSSGRANAVVSELRSRGHAVLLKRECRTRVYRLVSPLDFLFAFLHLPGLERVRAEAYKPLIIKTVRGLRSGLGSRLTSVGLFGSVARDEALGTSDVDLYVVADWKKAGLSERLDEVFPSLRVINEERLLLLRRGIATDVSVYPISVDEALRFHPLQLDLSREGIVLYDPERFLERTWSRLRVWLARKGARRVETEKGWFWQLDPGLEVGTGLEVR